MSQTTMLTASGVEIDLSWWTGHQRDNISIADVAHHLAQINRFCGAACRPYSVAEHSLLCVDLVEQQYPLASPSTRLAVLMHDAHEAYFGDATRPVKRLVGDPLCGAERRIQFIVLLRFGLATASHTSRDVIHWADNTALATERAALLPPTGAPWPVSTSHPPVTWVDFKARERFTWTDWRQAFLDRFAELQFARELQAAQLAASLPSHQDTTN